MLYFGNLKSNKTDLLIEHYADLLNSNVSAENILVIVQNSKLKEEFLKKVYPKLKIQALTKFNVYSFFGLCYNFILDYYPLLEEKISKGKPVISPHLCGLEASREIFKNTIEKINFKGYNSKTNLLHQLLRRQGLITLNGLSDDEVKERAKILTESFTYEISSAINLYKSKTLELRAFDYLRQVGLFSWLYKNVENPYKYVFIDDADEICPSLFEYLKYIKPSVKEFFITYDPKGSSRKGYLCGGENNFELFLNESPKVLKQDKTADLIFEKVKNEENIELENLTEQHFIRTDEMYQEVIKKVNELLNSNVLPCDILIIIPDNNKFAKLYLEKIEAPVNFITGSEKIEENKIVSGLISALRLLIEPVSFKISPYKLKAFLGQILKVDLNSSIEICQIYEADFCMENIFEILEKYKEKGEVEKFLELKNQAKDLTLGELLYRCAKSFVESENCEKENIQKINQLLKQIKDFEDIFKNTVSKANILYNLENTIIAENPLEHNQIKENAVNISTPQKTIDFQLKNKFMFLLDTTNPSWVKQDIGPLYNAWIFQKNRIKKTFTLEDNIIYTNDKIARTLRKLYLLSCGEIFAYSADFNFLGGENFKGIKHYFTKQTEEIKPVFKITPRKDQAPVLEYKGGKYAAMAVAGAGKTTIMLALIIKLLENKIKPENIFVLTYMDSACRTFKERIKASCPNLNNLPNISTIHGLCMRILKENNNHTLVGLDVDFDIIDEIKRNKLIAEIIYNEGIEPNKTSSYERAISAFKCAPYRNENSLKPTFKRIYSQYQRALKELNLIDYDDLLILGLGLLKSNSKIREYYRNLAQYVIEDEAQDSSAIQQELITIISSKHGNLIRCGDINQAITSTFTNSDTQGFKKFIQNNPNCKMNHTARNSTGVIDLANKLIQNGIKYSPTSFLEIETKPVSGKNLIDPMAYKFKFFDTEQEEKNFIVNKIKEIFEFEKQYSIGILTRTNKEAESYANYIKSLTPYKVISSCGLLSDNQVFMAVLAVFNFISAPMNNKIILEFAKTMFEFGFYKKDFKIFEKLEKSSTPFILEDNEDFSIWWDLRYFLELTVLHPYEAGFKIGEFYFKNNPKKRQNIAPVASLIEKIFNIEKNFEGTLNKMNEMKSKGYNPLKLFEDEEKEEISGQIKVLTLHKSKGDEFDYVFIPAMNEINLPLKKEEVKLKENTKITHQIQNSKKTEDEIKQEIIDENLRLLYVGITRAKKELYITCAREYKIFNKKQKTNPSFCFELLRGDL